jgi:hypothetical protein
MARGTVKIVEAALDDGRISTGADCGESTWSATHCGICKLKRSCNVHACKQHVRAADVFCQPSMHSVHTEHQVWNKGLESIATWTEILKWKRDVSGDGAEVDEEGPTSEQLSDIVAAASSVLAARGGKVGPGPESC